ncbi:MAG: hypothetical protein ACFFAA_06420 [Promethearchaeota archaeon]
MHKYRKTIKNNIDIASQYNEIIKELFLILQFNNLLKQKEILLRELELSIQYKKSSELNASKDLLNKLNESLNKNLKKLKLFEEDFFPRKNQMNQIKKTIDEYNSNIQKLTDQKKQCFNQINRITREMTGDEKDSTNDINFTLIDSTGDLSNAEKIRAFQKKAKEIQFEINDIKLKKSQSQSKLEEITPLFEILENDYQTLLQIINTDKKRIKELQSELKNNIKDDITIKTEDMGLIEVSSLRSSEEIKKDIEKTNSEINKIVLPNNHSNSSNLYDLTPIIVKLTKFYEKITNNEKKFTINNNEKEISECFEQFTVLENSLSNIELILNKFLRTINIVSQIRIILGEDQKKFLCNLSFLRNDKEQLKFEELTTPEKIFFIIVFYLSIELHTNTKNIVFSNTSIINQYNKAGSIYRTIRKILPIFEMDDKLSKFNLVFILSNLELKRTIKNLNIITIKES